MARRRALHDTRVVHDGRQPAKTVHRSLQRSVPGAHVRHVAPDGDDVAVWVGLGDVGRELRVDVDDDEAGAFGGEFAGYCLDEVSTGFVGK